MESNINNALYHELKDDNLSFIYLGKFDNTVLGMVTELWKGYLGKSSDTEGQKNKLSFLMIESFQNILRYGLSGRNDDETSGEIFVVRRIGNSYYITSGNFIDNAKVEILENKLNRVNTMTNEELKQVFVETLTNKQLSKEGGAGLGFVEMIRKTKEKLNYKFVPVDNNRAFFYFQLRLKISEDNTEPLPVDRTEYLKSLMEQHHKFLAVKGDFDRNTVNQILIMSENNIAELDSELTTQRKVYHIMVEMIQNISKHASSANTGSHDGLFSLGKHQSKYTITASNNIDQKYTTRLKDYIDNLNAQTPEQLDAYYKKVLRNGHDNLDITSGLGLIDIARESKNGIRCQFDNENTLVTIECNI